MRITQTEIHLEGFRFYAYHGVLEQERKVGGEYTIDLFLTLSDATSAIADDDLDGTVNYAEVYDLLKREMEVPSALLEHVCGRILQVLFDAFPLIVKAQIKLCKVNPPLGAVCSGCSAVLTAER